MRGTRANLTIRQGEAEGYQSVLSIEPVPGAYPQGFEAALERALADIGATHPGIGARRVGEAGQVLVPQAFHVGHEAHFGEVAAAFLRFVQSGSLPRWEVPGMLAKYRTTIQALALARGR